LTMKDIESHTNKWNDGDCPQIFVKNQLTLGFHTNANYTKYHS